MKQFALMFVLAGCVSVGCNAVKAADPEPIGVKPPTKPVEVAPAAVPAAAPAAVPAAVPAELAVPAAAAAAEPEAAKAVAKKSASSRQPLGKAAARSDGPPRVSSAPSSALSSKGGSVTSF